MSKTTPAANVTRHRRHRIAPQWLALWIIVTSGIWLATQTPWWSHRFPSADHSNRELTLDPLQVEREVGGVQFIHVSGRAAPGSRVTLFVDSVRFGGSITGGDRRFVFRSVPVRPGSKEVRAVARSLSEPFQEMSTSMVHTYEPALPSTPSFSGFPNLTTASFLTLRGTADPNVEILLTGVGKFQFQTRTNASGRFALELSLPQSGEYRLAMRACNRRRVCSSFSAPEVLVYDPRTRGGAATEVETSATLELAISHKEMVPLARVKLPKNDERALDLIAGHVSVENFLKDIFGDYTFGGISLFSSYFSGCTPNLRISGASASFLIQGQRGSAERLPTTSGEIEIGRSWRHMGENRPHILIVKLRDYTARTMEPAPQKWDNGIGEWTIDSSTRKAVRIHLDYDPFQSTASFIRFLRLSPWSFAAYPGSAVVSAIWSLFSILPILWLLLIVERWKRSNFDSPLISYVAGLSRWLLAFSLIALALDSAYALGYSLHNASIGVVVKYFPYGSSSDPLFLISGILILAIASAILALFSRRLITGNRVHRTLKALAQGFQYATLLGFAVLSSAAALTSLPSRILDSRLVSLVLLAPFSLLLALSLVTLGRLILESRWSLSTKGRILTVIFGVAAAFPFVTNARSAKIWQAVLRYGSYFFDALENWLPYAALLGAILLLKRASRVGRARRLLELEIGFLMFTGFLVGTKAHLLLIPLPFLIAILIFPRFVLTPKEHRSALDLSRKHVLAERVGLLRAVFESAEARRFREALGKLRKRVLSGEMTMHDFEQQRAQVETFVGEPRFGKRPRALEASEAVLSIGPFATDWENGVWALRQGAVLALPLMILYIFVFLIKALWLQNPFRCLAIGLQLVDGFADWLVGAFFLGYYFSSIRGTSGLRKGFRLSFAIVGCFLPVWLVEIANVDDLRAVVLRMAQIILFYTLLGVWAFDYQIFRQLPRKDFGWRELVVLEELPSLTALASVALAGAGIVINAVLSQPAASVLPLVQWFFAGMGTSGPPLP